MELKKTATFETPAIYVNCYGERNAVGKLAEFWDSHAAQGSCDFVNDVAIEMLMNRIEGFAIARDPAGEPAAGALNELLEGANLLINLRCHAALPVGSFLLAHLRLRVEDSRSHRNKHGNENQQYVHPALLSLSGIWNHYTVFTL